MTDALSIWVVFDHPSDQPDYFIVRRQWATSDGEIHHDPVSYGFNELATARRWLAQKGLTRLPRFDEDDPVILEAWL